MPDEVRCHGCRDCGHPRFRDAEPTHTRAGCIMCGHGDDRFHEFTLCERLIIRRGNAACVACRFCGDAGEAHRFTGCGPMQCDACIARDIEEEVASMQYVHPFEKCGQDMHRHDDQHAALGHWTHADGVLDHSPLLWEHR